MNSIDASDTELMMFIHPVRNNDSSSNDNNNYCAKCFSDKLLLPHRITGKIGKCCEQEEEHDDHHNEHDNYEVKYINFELIKDVKLKKDVKYWGLIIQSTGIYPLNGAYLMKTMKNSELNNNGCSCTHYSLVKVLEGISLSDQLTAAWII